MIFQLLLVPESDHLSWSPTTLTLDASSSTHLDGGLLPPCQERNLNNPIIGSLLRCGSDSIR